MTSSPDIVCLGEPLIEFNRPKEGDGRTWLQGFGGDSQNVAIAAARQGASTGYLTSVGQDWMGDAFLDLWKSEGVDASRVTRHPTAPTGVSFVTHSAAGHKFDYLRKNSAASLMTPDTLATDYIAGARIFHLSAIGQAISDSARASCDAAIDAARERVTMTLRPTISRVVSRVNDPSIGLNAAQSGVSNPVQSQIPVLAVREMDSVLQMRSGEVAVMGGLMQDSSENSDEGIPPFDAAPILGNLAKARDNRGATSELVILLRATILDNAAPDDADVDLYRRYNRDPRPLPFSKSSP